MQFRTGAASALLAFALSASSASATGDATNGETLFKIQCAGCHSLDPTQARSAPPLDHIVGRKAGASPGAAYSSALKASGLVWDAQTLGKYLAGPRDLVPGSTMFARVADALQRADIIAYLEQASGN